MIMIAKMYLLRVIAVESIKEELIDYIQDMGVVHLEEALPSMAAEGEVSKHIHRLNELSIKIRGLLDFLGCKDVQVDIEALRELRKKLPVRVEEVAGELESSLDKLFTEVKSLMEEKEKKERLYNSAHRYIHLAHHLLPFLGRSFSLGKRVSIFWVEASKSRVVTDVLRHNISSKEGELWLFDFDEKWKVVAISYPKEKELLLKDLLKELEIVPMSLPKELEEKSLIKTFWKIKKICEEHPHQIKELEEKISVVAKKWGPKILKVLYIIEDRIDQLNAISNMVKDSGTVELLGWIPKDKIKWFTNKLKLKFKDKVAVYYRPPNSKEWSVVPVLLENRPLFRPFEVFLRLLPPPRYGSVDPTPLVGIFFPLFCGVIVGDIGYGIGIFIVAVLIEKKLVNKLKYINDISAILKWCAFWSIVWGIMFGEFFGELGHMLGLHPLWVNRSEAIMPVMMFSIALGVFHVVLGLIIGAINSYLEGHKGHFWTNIALIGIVFGAILILLEAAKQLPAITKHVGFLLLALSIPILIVKGKIHGMIEALGVFGNILSYVRIMAVGLASVILAVLATELGGMTGSLWLGIIVAVMIHLLNLVLAIVDSSIQSARLHYVEFFNKFYVTSKRVFKPFKKRGLA